MARPKKEETSKKEDSNESQSPESVLAAELNAGKTDHHNFTEEVNYKVSTGSLTLDSITGGGISPGVIGVGGPFESGKSSAVFACMKNMLDNIPGSRGMVFKAESRLSKEMQERSGIKFVFNAEEWKDGTCFVVESNIFEFIVNLMRQLIMKNEGKKKYFFFIDSLDGLILKNDMEKELGENNKVAGVPLLSKQFLQKMAIAMTKNGHICALASQVSANIQIDTYSTEPARQLSGGGGNAKNHYSNFIFEFRQRNQGDLILENPSLKPDRLTNKILGHFVKIAIKKSPNEQTGNIVSYPIKYGRTDGKSVWREYEICDMLIMYGLLTKKGSWFTISEVIIAELNKAGFEDIPVQLQGLDNWRKWLEANDKPTNYLFDKFTKMNSGV